MSLVNPDAITQPSVPDAITQPSVPDAITQPSVPHMNGYSHEIHVNNSREFHMRHICLCITSDYCDLPGQVVLLSLSSSCALYWAAGDLPGQVVLLSPSSSCALYRAAGTGKLCVPVKGVRSSISHPLIQKLGGASTGLPVTD
jgi:hypothetical protein